MLTRAEVSLSVLVKAALDLLTFQLINLHAANPHAAKTGTFMDLGKVNPGIKMSEAKHLNSGV